MKKIFSIMLAVLMLSVLAFAPAAFAEGDNEIRMEAVREGDQLLLKFITNEEVELCVFGIDRVPVVDASVFTFASATPHSTFDMTPISDPTAEVALEVITSPYYATFPAETVLLTMAYDINLEEYVPGAEYTFTSIVEEAYTGNYDELNCMGLTLSATLKEESSEPVAPTVAFSECVYRTRPSEDEAGAMRVMFMVTFNDSYINYFGTNYGAEGEGIFEITAMAITLARTDVNPAIENTINCEKIFNVVDNEYFIYNVTLTGITERHMEWTFDASAEITYELDGVTATAVCDPVPFCAGEEILAD